LMQWCENNLEPKVCEAVCADMLTAFKEATYVIADSGASDRVEAFEHWGLSLPTYMHFTSPIRRYADILVHRRLAHIIGHEVHMEGVCDSLNSSSNNASDGTHSGFLMGLMHAVTTCNLKKRDAQDAQKDSMQAALSEYVCRCGGIEVDDAVITRIILPTTGKEELKEEKQTFKQRLVQRKQKGAIEFYIPVAQCSRAVSFDALNLELIPESDLNDAESTKIAKATCGTSLSKVRVRVKGESHEQELQTLTPLRVRLVSAYESDSTTGPTPRHWAIRFPWALGTVPSV